MSELSEWPTLSLGSPSDVELNPFLDTSVEQTRSIFPERSSFSSVCIIPKESLEELTLEIVRGQSRVLLSKSNEPISTRGSILVHITVMT